MLGIFTAKPSHPLADAKEIRRLVQDLPAQEPALALAYAGALFESLVATDDFRLDQRLDVVVQIDAAVAAHTLRLGREYLGGPEAGRAQESKVWSQCHDYWLGLSVAYDDILKRYGRGDKGAAGLTSRLPLLCARLLRACAGRLKWAQFRYGPIDAEIWATAGKAYLAAVANASERKPVATGANAPATSVEAEYLKLLLFQASSMGNLLPQEIEIAERLIAYLVPHFKLTDKVHPFNVCWVDPAKPVPPTRLAKLPEITPSLRFFATRTALNALNGLRLNIESTGTLPSEVHFGAQYAPRVVVLVCEHLATCWAPVPPMRGHVRHRVKSWLAVISGLDSVHRRLSGQAGQGEVAEEAWVAEDVSRNGMRANVPLVGKAWLRVGSLLGVQPDGCGNWLVGVVRRLSRSSDSFGDVGIETLSKTARAAVSDDGGRPIELILLDPVSVGDDVRVVIPELAWDPRTPLALALDGQRLRLQPRELVEMGAGYALGSYRAELI
jgi:hypothetical protein